MDYITFRNCTMQESEYKLPHALVGCKKEEDFKLLIATNNQQIHFFEEETGKHFEGDFFKNIKDLEFNSLNQFNVNLYRSFARFYEKEIGKYPSDEITLWSFNNAYRIAMDGLCEPLQFNINKYEKALSEVKIHGIRIPRDRQEVVAVICMAYAILEEEEEKSAKLNYVLSLTRASYHSFIKKMKNTQDATPPSGTTETETEEDVKTTPPFPLTSSTPPTAKRGAPKTQLFTDGKEEQYAEHFRNFLHINGYDLTFTVDMNDKVNIALRCFLHECDTNLDRKDTACFRFLKESCSLEYKTNHKEQWTGQKWCKEFKKVKDDTPKGATLGRVQQFIKDNKVLE